MRSERVRQSAMLGRNTLLCSCSYARRCFCFTLVARVANSSRQTASDLVWHYSFARSAGVLLRSYNIIYDLVDDIRAAMEGRLVTVEERTELGQAEARCCGHARACPRALGPLRILVLQ